MNVTSVTFRAAVRVACLNLVARWASNEIEGG